jgi:hypothetical protein
MVILSISTTGKCTVIIHVQALSLHFLNLVQSHANSILIFNSSLLYRGQIICKHCCLSIQLTIQSLKKLEAYWNISGQNDLQVSLLKFGISPSLEDATQVRSMRMLHLIWLPKSEDSTPLAAMN